MTEASDDVARTTVKRPYAPRMAPEERREQILDATLRVISDRGVHKVSIDSVAAAAGVTRPVIYKHFVDSPALLRASLTREEERARNQYRAAIDATPRTESPRDYGLGLYASILGMFEASPDLWRAVLELTDSSTPEFRQAVSAGIDTLLVEFADLLARLAGGEARDADFDVYARMLLAVILESGKMLLSEPKRFPRSRLVASMERLLAL